MSLSFPSSVRSYCLRPYVFRRLLSSCFVAEYLIPGRCNSARPAIRGLPLLQPIVVTANELSPFPVMQTDLFVAQHTKIDYYIESFSLTRVSFLLRPRQDSLRLCFAVFSTFRHRESNSRTLQAHLPEISFQDFQKCKPIFSGHPHTKIDFFGFSRTILIIFSDDNEKVFVSFFFFFFLVVFFRFFRDRTQATNCQSV